MKNTIHHRLCYVANTAFRGKYIAFSTNVDKKNNKNESKISSRNKN